MKTEWQQCKNILCIRPDNMGDLLMSSPALQALKKTFGCRVTVLTSSMAKSITPFIPCIDDVIIFDLPWVKKENETAGDDSFFKLIEAIKKRRFDAAIIFTVYSQNPLPSAMIAYLAGIPLRAAYCRENPYELLTNWLPDKEPYSFIQHQVLRDLSLTQFLGASITNDRLQLKVTEDNWVKLKEKLIEAGIDTDRKWLVIHAGASEGKRKYPANKWALIGNHITETFNYQVLFTGSSSDKQTVDEIIMQTGKDAYSLAGLLSFEEFLLLIKKAPLVISVNTVTAHIAAAFQTPLIVLYALTNPQHLPWKSKGKLFLFSIPPANQSRNEIIRFVTKNFHPYAPAAVAVDSILEAAYDILYNKKLEEIPAMLPNLYSIDELTGQQKIAQ
jgi:lipopolysaccharide heptosyltransferase II